MTQPPHPTLRYPVAGPATAAISPKSPLNWDSGDRVTGQSAISCRENSLICAVRRHVVARFACRSTKPYSTIPIAPKQPALSSLSGLSPLQLALKAATNLRQSGSREPHFNAAGRIGPLRTDPRSDAAVQVSGEAVLHCSQSNRALAVALVVARHLTAFRDRRGLFAWWFQGIGSGAPVAAASLLTVMQTSRP